MSVNYLDFAVEQVRRYNQRIQEHSMNPLPDDPVEALIAAEARADHAKAKSRGVRVALLAQSIASDLNAEGLLRGAESDVIVRIQCRLAEDLYGNAAVDLPGVRS